MSYTRLLLLAFVIAGPAWGQDDDDGSQTTLDERYGHLEKGKSGFQETWVNPDIDWARYETLYLWKGEFQYRDVGPAQRSRSTMMSTRQREFGISEEDREAFEAVVRETFVKEIQKVKNLALTDDPDPNTLIMRGALLDIVSRVPPDTVGRSQVYLASVGDATLVLELIDAGTGEVAAVVSERRTIGRGRVDSFTLPANRATITAEVRRWARSAATTLRKALDDAVADE